MSLSYLSTTEFHSKLAPGVTYRLRKLSQKRRIELNLRTAEVASKIADLQRSLDPVNEEIERAEAIARIEPCACNHPLEETHQPVKDALEIAKAADQVELVDLCHLASTNRCLVHRCPCREPKPDPAVGNYAKRKEIQDKVLEVAYSEMHPIYIRWGVAEIQGLDIDGSPATVDSLISDGPESLVNELGEEIQRLLVMSPDEVLGFKQPTTSGAAVDGKEKSTTAPSANEKSFIETANAAGISLI